ncbi:MAG TPA: GIY-YIG nuclease family protein [Coleofasciculaceae cyanobacterium]
MTSSSSPQPGWQQWAKVPFTARNNLPDLSGIYAVIDSAGEVWYVGKASNLKTRWGGRSHHRYGQLNRQNKNRDYQIYYCSFSLGELDFKEKEYIDKFKPLLNYSRVKTYARKPPRPHQELARILKVINKPNLLFNGHARSVVVGYYREVDEDKDGELKEFTCIVIAVSGNDHDGVIYRSAMKSTKAKGKYLADCWSVYETTLGLSEPEIDPETRPLQMLVFAQDDWNYEFAPIDYTVLTSLDAKTQALYTETITLNNQLVLALKDPACLRAVLPEPKPIRSGYMNKAWLRPTHYYHYRLAQLKPISELLQS